MSHVEKSMDIPQDFLKPSSYSHIQKTLRHGLGCLAHPEQLLLLEGVKSTSVDDMDNMSIVLMGAESYTIIRAIIFHVYNPSMC